MRSIYELNLYVEMPLAPMVVHIVSIVPWL